MAINIAILCRNVNAFRQLATRSRTTEQSLEASPHFGSCFGLPLRSSSAAIADRGTPSFSSRTSM